MRRRHDVAVEVSTRILPLSQPYLHHDFESVQGGRAGPGNRSGSSTCNQVPPPHAGLLLLHGELIWDHQVLPHIKDLFKRHNSSC